jgi:biotin transporter BioY
MHNPALYYFAGAILVTFVITVLLCRHRIAQKKKSFFATALVITVITNAVLFVVFYLAGRFYSEGWHVFTLEAWRSDTGSLRSLESAASDGMIFIVVGTLICILPALGVAYYYERRSKKNEIPAA